MFAGFAEPFSYSTSEQKLVLDYVTKQRRKVAKAMQRTDMSTINRKYE